MWMVSVEIMCRQHLLGEHNELHMFAGAIIKKRGLDGFITSNAVEVSALNERHAEVAAEMIKRGYKHNKDLPIMDLTYLPKMVQQYHIDKEASLDLLLKRCDLCNERATR